MVTQWRPTAIENRMIEDTSIAFAMFCDINGLTDKQGVELAGRLADELDSAADDRRWQDNVVHEEDDE